MSTSTELTNHFLFATNVRLRKFSVTPVCIKCVNADVNKIGPNGRIYCNKYKMWTYEDQTCKAGKMKD